MWVAHGTFTIEADVGSGKGSLFRIICYTISEERNVNVMAFPVIRACQNLSHFTGPIKANESENRRWEPVISLCLLAWPTKTI